MSQLIKSDSDKKPNQSQFRLFFDMMRDHFNKSYTGMSSWTIGLMIFALVYLVIPFDFDWLLPIGFIDDAVVIGFVLKHVKKEIEKYKSWKNTANP